MNTEELQSLLERSLTWPEGDQEELVEVAREIEARREGDYQAIAEDLRDIHEALSAVSRSDIAIEAEAEVESAFFRV